MELLHLLNGDATLQQFKQTNIKGDRLVWREMLCEGETIAEVGTPLFWEKRGTFLRDFAPDSFEEHFERNKRAFSEVAPSKYEEVVLWFEYDLFCQINLLGLLSWIYNQPVKPGNISLICLGHHPKYEGLVGLGEINPAEYEALFENRIELDHSDLEYANNIWLSYCSDDHSNLLDLIEPSRADKFPYLEEALRWHQKRFPNPQNGLDDIETQVVQLLAETPMEERKLVGKLLRRPGFYGFGDLQYFKYLEELAPILDKSDGIIRLNERGQQVAAGTLSFKSIRQAERCYGGVRVG